MLVGTLFAVFSPASTWLAINVGKDAAILVGKAVLAHAAILADIVALVVGLLRPGRLLWQASLFRRSLLFRRRHANSLAVKTNTVGLDGRYQSAI